MTRTVELGALSAADLEQAEAALASVPVSFRAGDGGDTAVVPGSGHWPDAVRRAADGGASTVLVVQPDPWAPIPAGGLGAQVVLVERFAGNPALVGAAIRLPESVGAVLVQVTAPAADPDSLVFEAVRALRSIGVADVRMATAVRSPSSVVVDGTAAGGRLSVVAAAGPQTELRIDVLGLGVQTSIRAYDATTARPAHVSWTDADGTEVAPTAYEHAFRAALCSVAAGTVHDPLPAFVEDVAIVGAVR